MKFILASITKAFALSLLFTNFVLANPTGMSPEQMQQMMKQAEAAQACMEKVDQSKLEALEVKGKKMQAEIQALCKAGKRDKAMTTAMEYSMQMKNDPALKEMSKCGEMMQGMMPKPFSPIDEGPDGKPSHVCDNI